jgi:hypothetical protein
MGRRRLLARIRSRWGKPSNHSGNVSAITEACRSRIVAAGDVSLLDDRTWDDLDLDDVLAAIDRTEGILGQQALYHRLRLKGRTPAGALMEALGVTEIPDIIPNEEVNELLPTAA